MRCRRPGVVVLAVCAAAILAPGPPGPPDGAAAWAQGPSRGGPVRVSAGTLRFKADGTDRRETRDTLVDEEEHTDIEVKFTRDGRMEFNVHRYYHRTDRKVRDASGRIVQRTIVERREAASGRQGSLMMRPTIKKFDGDWATVNTIVFHGDENTETSNGTREKSYKAIQIRVTPIIKFDTYEGGSYGPDRQEGKFWRKLDARWRFEQ